MVGPEMGRDSLKEKVKKSLYKKEVDTSFHIRKRRTESVGKRPAPSFQTQQKRRPCEGNQSIQKKKSLSKKDESPKRKGLFRKRR